MCLCMHTCVTVFIYGVKTTTSNISATTFLIGRSDSQCMI